MRDLAPSWPAIALAVACGILLGALVALAVNDPKPAPKLRAETVTISRTVTVQGPITNPGTVITRTLVPNVVGVRLDIAKRQLAARRFEVDVDGGGLFGVLRERNWRVTKQTPAAGTYLEQGSSVRVKIEK